MSTTPEQFMKGGGAPQAKWPTVGAVVEGTVLDWSMQDQTDYDTGERLFFDKTLNKKVVESAASPGSEPMVELVMTIQSEATGFTYEGLDNVRKDLPNDDGKRRLYIKAALRAAIIKALNDAQCELEVGARVRVERTKDGPQPNPKFRPPHQYVAAWTPAGQNPDAATAFFESADHEADQVPDPEYDAAPPVDDDPWAKG